MDGRRLLVTSLPVVVFMAALLSFLPWIGSQEIWTKDEARTALVVKEMLSTGDWTLPRISDGVYSRKPPFYHWLTALGARRGLDEVTLRVPAAVAGAASAALTYLVAAELASPPVGLIAAAMLVASPGFFEWARIGRMETLLVFCVTLSLWGLARWLRRGGWRNALVFGGGLGLGVLTKGPAGLLPLAVAPLPVLTGHSRPGRLRELALGLACALALPLAWLGSAVLTAADFDRFVESLRPTISTELARSPSHSLAGAVAVAGGFFPWLLLLPGCLAILARRRPTSSLLVLVALGWLFVVLAVFPAVVSTRAAHLVLAYPALSLIAAWAWQGAEGRERWWLMAPLSLGVIAVIIAGIIAAVGVPTLRFHDRPLQLPPHIGPIVSAMLLASGLGALALWRRGSSAAVIVLAGGVVATLLALDVGVRAPFYNRRHSMRGVARQLEARIPLTAEVGFIDAHRLTAVAAVLSRPVRQLPSGDKAGSLPSPLPSYILLPEAEFVRLAAKWSLQQVDDVLVHDTRYVLAMRCSRRCGSTPLTRDGAGRDPDPAGAQP